MSKVLPASASVNLANGITSLSVAASLTAILLATRGRIVPALFVGVVTVPCDVFDGAIARRRKTTSEFGAQLDSLSDAIGFGVLPATLGYVLGVDGIGSVVLLMYVLSAVWRLAYFHEVGLTIDGKGRQCFTGMPTTFAATLFYLTASISFWMPLVEGKAVLSLFFLLTAFLMNSPFAFPKRSRISQALWILIPIALGSLLLLRK